MPRPVYSRESASSEPAKIHQRLLIFLRGTYLEKRLQLTHDVPLVLTRTQGQRKNHTAEGTSSATEIMLRKLTGTHVFGFVSLLLLEMDCVSSQPGWPYTLDLSASSS